MFGRKKKEKIEKPMVIERIELSKKDGLQTFKVKGMASLLGVLSHEGKIFLLVNTRLDSKKYEDEIHIFVIEDNCPTWEGKYIDSVVVDNRIYHIKKSPLWVPGELP